MEISKRGSRSTCIDRFEIENIKALQKWIYLQICEDVQDIPMPVTVMQRAGIQKSLLYACVTLDSPEMGHLAQVGNISLREDFCLS